MNPEEAFRSNLENSEELYTLLLTENEVLKRDSRLPGESIIARKKELLPQLGRSLEELKRIRAEGYKLSKRDREVIKVTQNKLMKSFLVLRENERMVLKAATPIPSSKTIGKIQPERLKTSYGL